MTGQDTRARNWDGRLAALEARRADRSLAPLEPVQTIADRTAGATLRQVGSAWSERAFDGPFFETPPSSAGGISIGVVFVRSRDGDTGTRNPAALGGGNVDEHLIYEGLTRVAVDAVIAGAGTLHRDALFTVWRPELVALRAAAGLARHPAQVIMSADGSIAPEDVLLFNVPSVPVFVLTSARGRERLASALSSRPWVTAVAGTSLHEQCAFLRARGIARACSIGGRRSATALVDAGLVQDVYLTTTSATGAEPGTPWYTGQRTLPARAVLVKRWNGDHGPVHFEHLVLTAHGQT